MVVSMRPKSLSKAPQDRRQELSFDRQSQFAAIFADLTPKLCGSVHDKGIVSVIQSSKCSKSGASVAEELC